VVVQVACSAAGVICHGDQPSGRSEVTRAGKRCQVAGADGQCRTEDGTEAGHRFDDRGLPMLSEGGCDLSVESFDACVEGENVDGQFANDCRGKILTRQHDQLGSCRSDNSGSDVGVVAHTTVPQPRGQTCLTQPSYLVRTRLAGNKTTAPLHDL
jgi:hypothetical protein